ncbi:MAG: hypothetical protein R6T89_07395, partial [Candidatus Syntrophosphaera sp.]
MLKTYGLESVGQADISRHDGGIVDPRHVIAALREAIFNAIVHKDYTGAPIQLSVYNDKLILWNEGRL